MSVTDFREAYINADLHCPCKECPHEQDCKTRLLACEQFEKWLPSGAPQTGGRSPNRETYQRIYYGSPGNIWEEDREITLKPRRQIRTRDRARREAQREADRLEIIEHIQRLRAELKESGALASLTDER